MQSHHHSNADIGKGELAFSTKSAIDFTRVVEHRRKSTSKNQATTLREQRSLSLSETTRPSLSRSRNICSDPRLLADVSQHQCHPSPMKLPRHSVPVFPHHVLEPHDSAPGSNKISTEPKSSKQPGSTTIPKNWKPMPLPKPSFRPISPNPPHGTHANKSDVEDSANSSLPSAASPKTFAVLLPKQHDKVKKRSNSEPKPVKAGSRNEAAQKRSMYIEKSAGDSGDYEINDIGIGNDNSSCIDPIVEKNMAYGVVEMRLGDKSPPDVTAVESSVYEYIDMEIGNGPIGRMNTRRSSDYAYIDMEFEKPPTTAEKSSAGESADYEYVEMGVGNGSPLSIVKEYDYVGVGVDKPPSTVKNGIRIKDTHRPGKHLTSS